MIVHTEPDMETSIAGGSVKLLSLELLDWQQVSYCMQIYEPGLIVDM